MRGGTEAPRSRPDDALLGMLNLMCAVLKHNPEGQEFVGKLFSFLFALPSPTEKMYRPSASPP